MESLKENIKASETIKTTINFGGFYNSIHDNNIEWACESYYSDDNGVCDWDNILDNVDFKKLHGVYINLYCDLFSDWIKENYSIDIKFKNISLSSPREYNFETDKILCDITEVENESLIKALQSKTKFLDWLKDRVKSKSGFISFYDFDDAMNDKNEIFSVYALEYLASEYENTEFLNDYDRAYGYNVLYSEMN
jgi:hypothetical protein